MGTRARGQALIVPVAVTFSAALHVSLVAMGAIVVQRELASPPAVQAQHEPTPAPTEVDLEPPAFAAEGVDRLPPASQASDPPHPAGGTPALPRPDTGRAGRGGSDSSRSPAINLADRDDGIRLSPELQSRIDRDQLQRLATSKVRRSWEDGRYTTHPMELTFLASGNGHTMDRRIVSEHDPSRGDRPFGTRGSAWGGAHRGRSRCPQARGCSLVRRAGRSRGAIEALRVWE